MLLLLIGSLSFVACEAGDPGGDRAGEAVGERAAGRDGSARSSPGEPAGSPDRPVTRTGTIMIEGMTEPVSLGLYDASSEFLLPFTAYLPPSLRPAEEDEEEVRFTATFGDRPAPDAFLHVRVLPPGTDRARADAAAKGYKTSRGVPVSQGLEFVADELSSPEWSWAETAYAFRYEADAGWFAGSVASAERRGRWFLVVVHYPVEFGDGFEPRADLVLDTWRWGDGAPLRERPEEPPPIVEGVPGRGSGEGDPRTVPGAVDR